MTESTTASHDFICYVHEAWKPHLRPAPSTRDWMDQTGDKFAYRCLPLSIANAHGWELTTPVGFVAKWDGTNDTKAIEVRADPGMEKTLLNPASHFGYGVLSLNIPGIFRTPPDWNLMVMGSPNFFKDGLHPLTGIVETDWSPYTFTMNWKFTRPDLWVRFEPGDPICFLMPLPRNLLAPLEPQIRPLASAPEVERQFNAWSASRDQFHKDVKAKPPTKPTDAWQKNYYRGRTVDGQEQTDSHQTKLRLPEFVTRTPVTVRPVTLPPDLIATLQQFSQPVSEADKAATIIGTAPLTLHEPFVVSESIPTTKLYATGFTTNVDPEILATTLGIPPVSGTTTYRITETGELQIEPTTPPSPTEPPV